METIEVIFILATIVGGAYILVDAIFDRMGF